LFFFILVTTAEVPSEEEILMLPSFRFCNARYTAASERAREKTGRQSSQAPAENKKGGWPSGQPPDSDTSSD
jgi:hypothetical protein